MKIYRLVAALIAASLLLCSCTDSDMPSGELVIENRENIIRMSTYGVDTLNPLRTMSESAAQLLSLIYEPLFYHTENLKPLPGLADSVQISQDGLGVSVLLTKDAVWRDGSPLCAEDVVYSINEIKGNPSLYKHNVSYISSAEPTDDGGVWLTLYEPVMNIEGFLSFPIIKNGSADIIEEETNGTGAFKIAQKSAADLLLTPNEKYRESSGSVSEVKVRIMRNQAACVNAFEANELDIITSGEMDLGEKTPAGDITIRNFASNRFTFLGFNCTKDSYSEPYFRQAVAAVIDKQNVVEKALYGRGVTCYAPINPSAWFYTVAEGPELDIKGTMKKAGYDYSDGKFMDADGNQAEINILVPLESSQKYATAEIICAQLARSGFAAYIHQVEYEEYKSYIKNKNYDVFIGEVLMPDNLDPGFLTANDNYFGFDGEGLAPSISSLRQSRDDTSLLAAVISYEQAFFENPPFVPLYFSADGVVYNENLSGIEQPNFYNSLRGLDKWYFKALAE